MGKDLFESSPEAREVFDQANEILDFDLKKVCFTGPMEELQKTRYAQPAIFVTSIASFRLFEKTACGAAARPAMAAGLSLGEATALVASGAIAFADGVRFVRARGLFMDEASLESPGGMMAVLGLRLEEVEAVCCKTGAEVANLNCPGQIVVSARKGSLNQTAEACHKAGARRCVPLEVSGAFHSSCMDSASRRIQQALESIRITAPRFPVISNLTGKMETDPARIKEILVNQMNHRTLWEESMRLAVSGGIRRFYEIGPGKVLKGLMRKIDPASEVISLGTAADFAALAGKETHAA